VVCDRCGFDIYSKDIRIQWDNQVVCPTCYDQRHPQDFVRGRHDDFTVWPVRTDSTDPANETAVGSNTVPASTFLGHEGITTINAPACVAQSSTEGDVISLDTSAWFHNPSSETITYSDVNNALPAGLSIAAATGIVSGTITVQGTTYTNSVEIQATYGTSLHTVECNFDWTVTKNAEPDSIAGLCLWWDFSDTTTLWQDVARTIQADGDGDPVKYVDDKSAQGNDGDENNSDRWPFLRASGNGSLFTLNCEINVNSRHIETTGGWTDGAQPKTYIIVYKVPADDANLKTVFGSTNANGTFHGFDGTSSSRIYLETNRTAPSFNDVTYGTEDTDDIPADYVGEWKVATILVSGTSGDLLWNNAALPETGTGMQSHDADTVSNAGFKIGATFNNTAGWNSDVAMCLCYEGLLSAADRATIQTYIAGRWSLD
jgi:hypothetical protein